MMKKHLFILFSMIAIAGAIVFFTQPVGATPSTQIWIPSTDTQPFGTVHLGVDNYTTFFKTEDERGRSFPTNFGITAGVAETELMGVEIGIDLREQSDDPVYFNAKLQLIEDSFLNFFPAIALGGYDFGSNEGVNDYNILYFLMSKTFPVFGRISLGYYYGNEDRLIDADGKSDNSGILASWDRTVAEIDDRLWVAVDYMGGNSAYGALSFGFAWKFAPNISAILGYDIFNDTSVAGENTLTVQMDIDF